MEIMFSSFSNKFVQECVLQTTWYLDLMNISYLESKLLNMLPGTIFLVPEHDMFFFESSLIKRSVPSNQFELILTC